MQANNTMTQAQANYWQYFKSIEQVATSQGFGQSIEPAAKVQRKRDSVLEKLDSPRSPTAKSFLAGPKPDLTRQLTAEPQSTMLSTPQPELTRAVTPDLIPDAMHERLPAPQQDHGLAGLEVKEPSLSSMHERVDSAQVA